MKKLILILMAISGILNNAYCQSELVSEYEVNVGTKTYLVMEYEHMFQIINKADSLRYLDQGYDRGYDKLMQIFLDRTIVDSLTRQILAPFIKKAYINSDRNNTLGVGFFFGMDGIIREVCVNYPHYLNLPMPLVDAYLTAILNSKMTCSYKKGHWGLRKARFITKACYYDLEELAKQ